MTNETVYENGKSTSSKYSYDKNSNRISLNSDGTITNYSYNSLNQLVSDTNAQYAYDLNGNLVSKTESGKVSTYSYDLENHLVRTTVQSGQSVSIEEYAYDWAGNRISKTTEGSAVRYLVDTNGLAQVLAETDFLGNLKTWYTRGDELVSLHRENQVRYYIYDGHGNVRALTDENGAVTDTYAFDAYGVMLSKSGGTENSYLYCGEQRDEFSGLYYLRARYMNPANGVFITMDAYHGSMFDPISLHKYLYANANPVMNSDPTGYFTLSDFSVSNAIQGVLSQIPQAQYASILKMAKIAANIATFVDVSRQFFAVLTDPNATAMDLVGAVAMGIVTGALLKYACNAKVIGPYVKEALVLTGLAGGLARIDNDIKQGDWVGAVIHSTQLIATVIGLGQSNNIGTVNDTVNNATDVNTANNSKPRNKPIQSGNPNSVNVQRDANGNVTKYTEFGNAGELVKEVRLTGKEHGGIPRPNVKEPNFNVNPKTGEIFQNGYTVRPATIEEITKIK